MVGEPELGCDVAEVEKEVPGKEITIIATIKVKVPDTSQGEELNAARVAEELVDHLVNDVYLDDYIPFESTWDIEASAMMPEPCQVTVWREDDDDDEVVAEADPAEDE